jgi:hypothetical protein
MIKWGRQRSPWILNLFHIVMSSTAASQGTGWCWEDATLPSLHGEAENVTQRARCPE